MSRNYIVVATTCTSNSLLCTSIGYFCCEEHGNLLTQQAEQAAFQLTMSIPLWGQTRQLEVQVQRERLCATIHASSFLHVNNQLLYSVTRSFGLSMQLQPQAGVRE